MESLKPPRSLVEQAYERILDAICDGSLAPGARVTQDELAARLAVSRQPVMTALGLLRQQGFLVEHGRRGLQVAPVDRVRFDAIYQFRSAIEEDVDVIGVSILSGAHMTVFPRIVGLLKERHAEDILVVGGGVIPDEDLPKLRELGVRELLLQDTPPAEIVASIRRLVEARGPR